MALVLRAWHDDVARRAVARRPVRLVPAGPAPGGPDRPGDRGGDPGDDGLRRVDAVRAGIGPRPGHRPAEPAPRRGGLGGPRRRGRRRGRAVPVQCVRHRARRAAGLVRVGSAADAAGRAQQRLPGRRALVPGQRPVAARHRPVPGRRLAPWGAAPQRLALRVPAQDPARYPRRDRPAHRPATRDRLTRRPGGRGMFVGALVPVVTSPLFGAEDPLQPVSRAAWYHGWVPYEAALGLGGAPGAAAELAWHAVGVDLYAYHPLWRLAGGPARWRG